MATSAPLSEKAPEETNNPGQELADREFNPDSYHKRQATPAGDASDPRGGDAAELAALEKTGGGPKHENQVGKGYTESDGSQLSRFSSLNKFRRRRTLLGGGLMGSIIAILISLTFLGGPFEFIHIAQLLEKFHFAGLQSQQDDRFAKEVRLFRFASKGQIEKTRLSFLGNKYADRFETKLNASGLESSYTKTFGLFDGYVIDENSEKFKNMDREKIKQYVKENYGVDTVDGGTITGNDGLKGKLVINASKLGYLDNYKLTYGLLRESGYSKLSSAIGARYLCQRAACTSMLHPLTKKVGGGKRSIEDWWNNRNNAAKEGSNAPEITAEDDPNTQKDPAKKSGADSVKGEVEGDKSLTPKEITAKLSGGAAAVAGVLCVAKGVAADAHNLKAGQAQVLMRMAVESMALGSQIESGQDINMDELAQYNTLLTGTDSTGKSSSWDEAQSIQSNLGNQKTGIAPSKTLGSVTNDSTPFDFLNNAQPLASVLGAVCSTVGQAITLLGGGIEGLVQTAVLGIVLSQTSFASDLAHWLAGNAVDVTAVGADFGSEIDYGAALAANSQAVLAGGSVLSPTQAATLQSATNTIAQEQFDRQSFVHKVFSPYDSQSAISKVIDSSSPSPTQNLAKMGSMLLNIKGAFSSMASLFGGRAKAATPGFNYGFPTYGFSQADMTNPAYANPYENTCYVVGCSATAGGNSGPIIGFLTGSSQDGAPLSPSGKSYTDRAETCFGALISQVTVQTDSGAATQWDVNSSSGDLPNTYDSKYPKDCADTSDGNWIRLRFFIMDTETMNSMSCYEGDNTACTDIGFSQSAGSPTGSTTTPTSPGNYQDPLRDIKNLKAGRVDQGVDYSGSGPIHPIGNGKLVNINNPGWAIEGGPPTFMVYQLSDGPAQGKFVYVAENCLPNPSLSIGSTVNSNTALCTLVNAPPNLEIGWAEPCSPGGCGNALAKNVWGHDVDNTAHYTAYGRNFSDLLQSFSEPAGTINTGADLLGALPAGWPTW